jgi:hypothetical protein
MGISSAEPNIQRWRAIAELQGSPPALITLAPDIQFLRENFESAYYEVLDEEERSNVKKIHFERYEGLSTKGHWKHYSSSPAPKLHKI